MIVEDCAPDELLGVRVLHVAPGSAADQAGLGGAQDPRTTFLDSSAPWTGHVITAADLHAIGNVAELEDYLATRAPGQAVQLSVRWSLDPSARTGETSMIVRAP